jgi:hypothetical protein
MRLPVWPGKRAFFFLEVGWLHFPTKLSAGKGLAIWETDLIEHEQARLKSADLL